MIPTTKQRIWAGIAEMLAGHNARDDNQFARGQAIVNLALDAIPAPDIDPNLLWELHQTGTAMCDAALPELDIKAFLAARERHQRALSKIREGGRQCQK